jgi:hypothetical protein
VGGKWMRISIATSLKKARKQEIEKATRNPSEMEAEREKSSATWKHRRRAVRAPPVSN